MESFSNIPFQGKFFKKYFYALASFCFLSGILLRSRKFVFSFLDLLHGLFTLHLDFTFWLSGFSMAGACMLLLGFLLLLHRFAGNEGTFFTRKQFLITSGLFLLLFYWNTLLDNAVNVPVTDDFFLVLNFLNAFTHLTDIQDQWQLITSPYVETRNVLAKLIIIGAWKLTGMVNFRVFIILINGCLMGIIYFIYKGIQNAELRKVLLLPVLLIMLQFSYYDAQVWTTAGLHIIITMMLVYASFYFLVRIPPGWFIAALAVAFMACFSYGNGLLVLPAGIIILLNREKKTYLILWLLFLIMVLILYFRNYHPVRGMESAGEINPVQFIMYCFAFWGSAFQFMYRLELPVIAGALFLLMFVGLVRLRYYRTNPLVFSMLFYIVGSAMMAAFFRLESESGVKQALSMRYVIYSCTGICCSLIALSEVKKEFFKNRVLTVIYFSSSAYFVLSALFFYPEVEIRREKLSFFAEEIRLGKTVTFYPPVIPYGSDTIVKRAVANGIYNP